MIYWQEFYVNYFRYVAMLTQAPTYVNPFYYKIFIYSIFFNKQLPISDFYRQTERRSG